MRKSLLERVSSAWRAFRTADELIAAQVRASDIGNEGRYAQVTQGELVARCRKYVAICARINAAGVAKTPLRVCRRLAGSKSTAFDTKRLTKSQAAYIRTKSGMAAKRDANRSDDIEEIIDPMHPAVRLFADANPLINGYELFEQTELLRSITGNFYWSMVMGREGWPVELWPLFPQFVRIKPSKDGLVDAYIFGRGVENEMEIQPGQVAHFKGPNSTGDPFYGMGDLAAVVNEQDISVKMSLFALNTLDNGAQPGLIVKLNSHSSEERKQVEAQVFAKHGGVRNAARSLVLGNGKNIEIDRWEPGKTELAYLGGMSDENVRNIICAAFGVPVGMLTMEEKSLANGKMVRPLWQENSLHPRLQRMEDTINQRVMPWFRWAMKDDSLFVCFDNPVADDVDAQSERAARLYPLGIITLNEARNLAGLDPVDDGDEIEDSEPQEPTDDQPEPQDDPQPEQDDKPEPETKAAMGCACGSCTGAVHKDKKPGRGSSTINANTEKAPDPPKGLLVALRKMFAAIEESIYDYIAAGGTTPELEADAKTIETFARELAVAVEDGHGIGKVEVQPFLHNQEFAFPPIDAVMIAKTQAAKSLKAVAETTKAAVREAIVNGLEQGLTNVDLAREVRAASGDLFSPSRALTIARTETNWAMNLGKVEAYRQSGIVKGLKWVLSGDPCPLCQALSEREVTLGRPFAYKGEIIETETKNYVIDFQDVLVPGPHPNCGCTVAAILVDTNA